jgi:hypothetical protein
VDAVLLIAPPSHFTRHVISISGDVSGGRQSGRKEGEERAREGFELREIKEFAGILFHSTFTRESGGRGELKNIYRNFFLRLQRVLQEIKKKLEGEHQGKQRETNNSDTGRKKK